MQKLTLPQVAGLEPEEAKQVLRSAVRKHRQQRTEKQRQSLAPLFQEQALKFVDGAGRVACYVSVNAEPPTHELCTAIADRGIELLLPKLGPGLTRAWGFFKGVDDLAQLAPGRPPEPSGPAFDNDILASVDALIIPGLLISRTGARLGQGGGWYDRALKSIPDSARVGAMVFADELVDIDLPQDENDMPVGFAITSEGVTELQD